MAVGDLNSLDVGILLIFFASVLIGVYRGFLRETLTIFTWGIASTVAYLYGKQAATLFAFADTEAMRNVLGTASVFALVVLVGFVIKFAVCKAFSIGGPSGLDRTLGSIFGLCRATAIVVAVLLLSSETLISQPIYKESKLVPKFKDLTQAVDNGAPKNWKEDLKKEVAQYTGIKEGDAAAAAKTTAAPAAAAPSAAAEPATHNASDFTEIPVPPAPSTTTPKQ